MASTRVSLIPNADEVADIIGQNGTGKSYLIRAMIDVVNGRLPIYVLDTKDEKLFHNIPHSTRVTRYADIKGVRGSYPVIVYTPTARELANEELLDQFCEDRYNEGNCLTVIDETTQVIRRNQPGPGALSLLSRGRGRKAPSWWGMQRPSSVSRWPFSEGKAFYVFRLNDKQDRARVAEFTHPTLGGEKPGKHRFWFYRTDFEEPVMAGPI